MSVRTLCLTCCLALVLSGCATQHPVPQRESPGRAGIVRYDAALDALIATDARIETLASGFAWSEGPVWIAGERALLFNDVPGNTMFRWSESRGLEVFLKPSGLQDADTLNVFREPGANGMEVDAPGQVLVADHGSRALVRLDLATKKKTVLADRYDGRRFNSPNDIARRRDGVIFFTDPPYGLRDLDQSPYKEQAHNGVYRRDLDGSVVLLDAALSFPNGVALSPDENTLYVANSDPGHPVWMRYRLDASGAVVERALLADASDLVAAGDPGLPDGIAVAASGALFATGPGGVLILSAEGKRLGRIETGTAIANCAFGDDGHMLYLTAHQHLMRVPARARGVGF
jgi:gluconolactonase